METQRRLPRAAYVRGRRKGTTTEVGWAEYWTLPGRASDFIEPLHIEPGDNIVLVDRVSGREQHRNKAHAAAKLAYRTRKMRDEVKRRGGVPIRVKWPDGLKGAVESGWEPDWLLPAIRLAKKHKAKLLAPTPDRYVRNHRCGKGRLPQAILHELEALHRKADGVVMMTWLHPDASPGECDSLLSRWGKEMSTIRQGRPAKKTYAKWSLEIRQRARDLRVQGMSLGRIATCLEVPKPTLQYWLRDVPKATV